MSWVPAPATSNPSCRFPAMGLPVCFRLRVMGLSRLAGLSEVTMVGEAGNHCRVPAARTATSYSTFSTRILFAPGPASDVPEPSSLPSYPIAHCSLPQSTLLFFPHRGPIRTTFQQFGQIVLSIRGPLPEIIDSCQVLQNAATLRFCSKARAFSETCSDVSGGTLCRGEERSTMRT